MISNLLTLVNLLDICKSTNFKKTEFPWRLARESRYIWFLYLYDFYNIYIFNFCMVNFKRVCFSEGRKVNRCVAITDAFDSGRGKKISWRAVPVAVPQIEVAVSLETCVAPTCRTCRPTCSAEYIYVDRLKSDGSWLATTTDICAA